MAKEAQDPIRPVDQDGKQTTSIDTGGGAYVAGNVDTRGGDFIGRDLIVKIAVPAALAVVLAVSAAIVAVATGWELPGKVQVALCPYAEDQKELPSGDFNIAIAPFSAPDEKRQDTGSRLSRWLAKQLYDPSGSVAQAAALQGVVAWSNDWPVADQIKPPMKPIPIAFQKNDAAEGRASIDCKTNLSAEEWLSRLRAHLVVFGELEDSDQETELKLSFYYQAPVDNLPDITLDYHPFGSSIPIPNADSPVLAEAGLSDSAQLDKRVAALVHLVDALASVVNGNPQAALRKFEDTVSELDLAAWDEPQVSSTLYYYMGQAALQVPDLAKARDAFQTILDHHDRLGDLDLILATVGLGNVDYLQADGLLLDTLAASTDHFCFPTETVTAGENACFDDTFVANLLASAQDQPTNADDAHAQIHELLQQAVGHYNDALAMTEDLGADVNPDTVQEIRGVTQAMKAHALRRTADTYLDQFEQHAFDVALDPNLLDQDLYQEANSAFVSSADLFSDTVKLLNDIDKPGLVAFTEYGEGLVKERYACSVSLADPEGSTALYAEAAQSFADCSALEEPTDDVSRRLFRSTQCLCENAAGRLK
ncbi:MAG: hypothetical protein ACK2UO_11190 [Caldilineaceae bacterium]